MNELEEQLSVILGKALSVAEQSGEFIIEQAPILLQEFYQWQLASYIMSCLLFIPFLIMFMRSYKSGMDDSFDNPIHIFGVMFGGVGSMVGFVMLIEGIYNIVFMTVAPKLYLIDYFVK
jgi:hypothetical protein